jgi:hypothetical protein
LSSSATARAPTIAAIGGRTRSDTSSAVVAVIRSAIASCTRRCSGRRQIARSAAGGARPSRKVRPLTVPRSAIAAETAEPSSGAVPARRSAAVIAAAPKANICIRLRETPRCVRPARQSRYVTTIVSTLKCTRNPTM